MSEVCGIILAAGEGKRMKSNLPKVLSRVLDKPMLKWVIDAARGAGIEALCVVDGFKREEVERYLATLPEAYETAFQAERKGTAHAVMQARGFLERHRDGDVLILNGDAPFLERKPTTAHKGAIMSSSRRMDHMTWPEIEASKSKPVMCQSAPPNSIASIFPLVWTP